MVFRRGFWLSVLVVLALSMPLWQTLSSWAYPYTPLPYQPGFTDGKVLSGAAVDYASPTLADLDGDGNLDIVIGGRDAMVYAVDSDGVLLWQFDAAAALNAVAPIAGTSRIDSAVAVGDLDGNGQIEVVIAASAEAGHLSGYNGGVVVLNRLGVLQPGWPQLSLDHGTPESRDGYMEGFYSSPALGDLDGDGDLEIVAGSWDMRVYAWHHDGSLVKGWPRFAFDSVWSSPALADLDRDGRLEVIIGVDAHDPGIGGYLHVFRYDATEMPGFPKGIDQTIYSSPAIADLNGDGWLDIVVGTGNYYAGAEYAVYAWDRLGNALPGWPAATGGYVLGAPSVGDIDGDSQPEVVVGCNDGKAYAFNGNGSAVSGWPVTVQDNLGNTGPLNYSSPVLANFDADAAPEVFINHFCDTVVLDGNGTYLTHVGNSGASGKPNMYMLYAWCLGTTPAVADIDQDGYLEIVRAGGQGQPAGGGNALLYVWESDRTPATTVWPMFRHDAMHHATYQPGVELRARVVSHTLPEIMVPGESRTAQIVLENTGTVAWTSSASHRLGAASADPFAPNARVDLAPGESVEPGQRKTFTITLQAPATPGFYETAWRMLRDGSGWFGQSAFLRIKVGNEPAFYVLSKVNSGSGGVYAGGLASALVAPAFDNWPAAKGFGFLHDFRGYQFLDTAGGVWQGGSAQAIGGHGLIPYAQEVLIGRNDTTYYVIDGYGNVTYGAGTYPFSPAPPTFAQSVIRSAALTADNRGIYTLEGNGNVYTGGNAPTLTPATPNFGADIAKRIKLTANGAGYYVLDAYGRIWTGGAAPAIAPNYAYHVDEDWARDFELTADGQGYYLLDKEGNIYTGGTAVPPTINLTPVWTGQNVALDLAVADSRILETTYLSVSPASLGFLSLPDESREYSLRLTTVGFELAVTWSASESMPWLSMSAVSGISPATLTLSVDTAGLAVGTYTGVITFSSPDVENSPVEVTVQLVVASVLYEVYLPLVLR
ncbi:MAG: VCBS repeat-containing protein [Anaerolineae bacterium]|nr:VCBS repeat-containing protein [Anaerolineae bacterium]